MKTLPTTPTTDRPDPRRAGFTLTEVIVASGIGSVVMAALLWVFTWSLEQSYHCQQVAWSQNEAMTSSARIANLIRGASSIRDIDEEQWNWVELGYPDGTWARLVYTNGVNELRDGHLLMFRDGQVTKIIARGMTAIMTDGFSQPVFQRTGTRALRVSYRVTEPVPEGGAKQVCDGRIAGQVRFGVCLRNTTL